MSASSTDRAEHTPGPWKAEPFRVQIPTAHGVVDGPLMSYLAGNKHTAQGMTVSVASERVADHVLCAAAPDLLEALEKLLAGGSIWEKDEHIARAAIAKARSHSNRGA